MSRIAAVVAALILATGVLVGQPAPARAVTPATVDHVVVIGAPGLRWTDINPTDTPALWRLARTSALGSLVVRSAQEYTCPSDGWLTLGAGNRVRLSSGPGVEDCEEYPAITPRPGGGGVIARHRQVLEDNANLTYRARPGVLAELVECTVAVGPGAALAAARPGVGRVDRYHSELPEDPAPALASCPLAIVDAGTVTDADRRAQVRAVDATAARVLEARPENCLVIVAGVADVSGPAHLHVAMVEGPGVGAGDLRSWRDKYVSLIDVAPTIVEALGIDQSKWFSGEPITVTWSGDRRDVASAVKTLVDADRAAWRQPALATWFARLVVVFAFLLCAAAVPVLWRIRRAAATEDPRRRFWTAVESGLEVAAVAASLLIPAAWLANAVPWWRSDQPGWALAATTLGFTLLLTAAVRLAPWWHAPLGPVASVAGVITAIVAADLLSGGHLQLDSVAGHSAIAGGRYAGLSAIGAGVFAVAVLLLAGVVAQIVPRRYATLSMAAIGGGGVLLAGTVGLDTGSAIALTIGVCLATAACGTRWLTANRILAATVAGAAVTGLVVLLALNVSPHHGGRLGRFFADIAEGVPGALINRTMEANAITFADSPYTGLAIGGALFGGLVLLRPTGGLLRVYGLYPAIRAACLGSGIAALLGGLVDGAAVVVVGAATATVLPLLILLCLRALSRAHLRSAPQVPPAAGSAIATVPSPRREPSGAAADTLDGEQTTAAEEAVRSARAAEATGEERQHSDGDPAGGPTSDTDDDTADANSDESEADDPGSDRQAEAAERTSTG